MKCCQFYLWHFKYCHIKLSIASNEVDLVVVVVIITIIVIIIIIIIIIIINIYSGSIYKYNGYSPYKLKKYINKKIKTVKITYKSIHDKYMGSLNTSRS